MKRTVAVVGTLDTKGPEYRFLLGCLRHHGLDPVVIDISLRRSDPGFDVHHSVDDVAGRAGAEYRSVAALNKGEAGKIMAAGARAIVQEMQRDGRLAGIIALGGANGTILCGEIMKSLPVHLPKLIVCVVAAADPRVNVGTKDIVLVNAISDMCLNRLTGRIIANAAAAFAGMILLPPAPVADSRRRLVGATMLGLDERFVSGVKRGVEQGPYEVVVFHANGVGGLALEGMLEEDLLEGILDLTLNEPLNHLLGGVFDAGPGRLDAALKKGLPMVIAPGCTDFVNFWGRNIPAHVQDRIFYFHNTQNTLMRSAPEETFRCGGWVGEKLNGTRAPVKVLVPLLGVSALDREGGAHGQTVDGRDAGPWHRPEAVQAFADGLRRSVSSPRVDVVTLQAHINDEPFARAVAGAFLDAMAAAPSPRAERG